MSPFRLFFALLAVLCSRPLWAQTPRPIAPCDTAQRQGLRHSSRHEEDARLRRVADEAAMLTRVSLAAQQALLQREALQREQAAALAQSQRAYEQTRLASERELAARQRDLAEREQRMLNAQNEAAEKERQAAQMQAQALKMAEAAREQQAQLDYKRQLEAERDKAEREIQEREAARWAQTRSQPHASGPRIHRWVDADGVVHYSTTPPSAR